MGIDFEEKWDKIAGSPKLHVPNVVKSSFVSDAASVAPKKAVAKTPSMAPGMSACLLNYFNHNYRR